GNSTSSHQRRTVRLWKESPQRAGSSCRFPGASTASCGRSDTNGSLEPQELAGGARERSAKRNVRLLELLVFRGGVDHLVEVVGCGLEHALRGPGVDLLRLDLEVLGRPGLGRGSGLLCRELRLLRLLHRLELLVGRQLSALGDDKRLHLDADVLEDVDGHRVAADALDVVEIDLAPVDADLARA